VLDSYNIITFIHDITLFYFRAWVALCQVKVFSPQ
jgi:hypothetical protein